MQFCNVVAIICGWLLLLGVAFLPRTGLADMPASLQRVVAVLNGKSVQLEDGETVRLAGLQVPNLAEKAGKMRPGQPMGEASQKALETMVLNQPVQLSFGPSVRDRKGRLLAELTLQDGRNIQQEMLKQGMAMVYFFPDNRTWLKPLLAFEQEARAAGRGIWAHPYWQVADAASLRDSAERYRLIEGVPRSIKQVGKRWFINFGEDWKTDVTAMIPERAARDYFKGIDIAAYQGKRLRLRGWIYRYNGPMLDLLLPEQVEVLGD